MERRMGAEHGQPLRPRDLLTAFSPTFEVFTGAQLFNRALVNTVLIVAGIAAVEDAPEGARAFATGHHRDRGGAAAASS